MGRLEELKAKTWPKLSKDEKKEYSLLLDREKRSLEQVEGAREALSDAERENIVEVDKKSLSDLLARVEQLEKEKKGHIKKAGLFKAGEWSDTKDEKRVNTATIRKYRETTEDPYRYALDWKFLQRRWNEKTREDDLIYQIYLYDPADKGSFKAPVPISKPLRYFVKNFDKEQVNLLEKRTKKQEKVVGDTYKTVVRYDKHSSTRGELIPQTVTRLETEFLIELESGEQFWLNADRLNA